MCEIWSSHVSYLSKEHSFINISPLRQSHRLPKSLKTKFAWDMFPKPDLKNNMLGLAELEWQTNTLTHLSVSCEGETNLRRDVTSFLHECNLC